jgi:phospholipase C
VRRAIAILVAAIAGVALLPGAPAGAVDPATHGIQHLVVIVEENSTYDHTFGTIPLFDGIKRSGKPVETQLGDSRLRLQPFSRLPVPAFDVAPGEEILSNGVAAAREAFNGGDMNGFYRAQKRAGKDPSVAFSYLDRGTPSPWRRLARQGVVFDNYFSSELGGSLPNTLNMVAGTSAGLTDSSQRSLDTLRKIDLPTIFDAASGTSSVSWRYYVGGLSQIDPNKIRNGDYARSKRSAPSQLYWAPILSMMRFWDDPSLSGNIRSQNDFFHDAATGQLPNITYVLPQPTTHEPRVLGPDLRVLSVVNALRSSPQWANTAALIVWDDWGGYYDHVVPPKVDGQRLGFRVPMMLLSPYVQPGTVNSTELDHSAIPALAASLFHLPLYTQPGRTTFPTDVWTPTPEAPERVVALSHQPRYTAAGMQHAPSVFILYLLTIVMITGVLFVVGVTLRTAPDQEGTVP